MVKQPKFVGKRVRTPKPPPVPKPTHGEIVFQARESLLALHQMHSEKGVPPHDIFGLVIDVSDPLAPPDLVQSTYGREVMKAAAKHNGLPILTGALPRADALQLIFPVAKRVEQIADNVIALRPEVPAFIKAMAVFRRHSEMPVLVVFDGQLSAQSVALPLIIAP